MRKFNLSDGTSKRESLKHPVSVCLTESESLRWDRIRKELKEINKILERRNPDHKVLKLSQFSRVALLDTMNEVERLINEIKATA